MAPIQMYNFRSLGGRGALVHRRHADVSGSLYLKQCVSCACLFQNVEMCSTSARFRNVFFRVIFLASFFKCILWKTLDAADPTGSFLSPDSVSSAQGTCSAVPCTQTGRSASSYSVQVTTWKPLGAFSYEGASVHPKWKYNFLLQFFSMIPETIRHSGITVLYCAYGHEPLLFFF